MTPTALSLRLLRSWGFQAAVVERWLDIPDPATGGTRKIRRDCFGGFDLLAVDPKGKATWLIQTTTAGNLSSRIAKIRSLPAIGQLLAAGVVCEAWGWHRKRERWTVRRVAIDPNELCPVEVTPRRRGPRPKTQGNLFGD